MSAIRLDLSIYPLPVILRGIDDYRQLADIAIEVGSTGDSSVELNLHASGPHAESLVADEFLNYLMALLVKIPAPAPAQARGAAASSLEP